jgi:hypothetical protein
MADNSGKVVWNELMTSDLARSQDFWGKVAGWSFETVTMADGSSYVLGKSGGEMRVGMMARQPGMGEGPDSWTAYVEVPDCDAAAAATTAGGGSVVQGPFDVPGIGRIALITDATGAFIGLMTSSGPAG